jgi:hypothetical protein
MSRGRICKICGNKLYRGAYVAHKFSVALMELGIDGIWAHPNCIAAALKYKKGLRNLHLIQEDDYD